MVTSSDPEKDLAEAYNKPVINRGDSDFIIKGLNE